MMGAYRRFVKLYFSIVPDLAEADLTGLDVAQSSELIKKYIWDLWP
jgi:hypothetical protein